MLEGVNWNQYVGIPWVHRGRELDINTGLDCYGLVRLFYKQEYDIILPKWDVIISSDNPQVTDNLVKSNGVEHDHPFIETTKPNTGDVVLMNILGFPVHVGIFVNNKYLLHSRQQSSLSEIVSFDKWSKRVDGYYTIKNK